MASMVLPKWPQSQKHTFATDDDDTCSLKEQLCHPLLNICARSSEKLSHQLQFPHFLHTILPTSVELLPDRKKNTITYL